MKLKTRTQQQAIFMQRFITLTVLIIMMGMFIVGRNMPEEKKIADTTRVAGR